MTARKLLTLIVVFILFQACSSPAHRSKPTEARSQYKASNVVILVIDGPRQTEFWHHPTREYIPSIATKLAPKGVVYDEFLNKGSTYTTAGHTAITTGFYQDLNNSGSGELPQHPGLFQIWRKASGEPASRAWVITTKDKLDILANTSDPNWKDKFTASTNSGVAGKGSGSGYRSDAQTWEVIQKILPQDHPRLVLINLKEPDSAGHSGKWDEYLEGIRASDEYSLKIWKLLEADPFYAGNTAFFVTHDHGRHEDGHEDGYISHGDSCRGCRHIFCLAIGPDFKKGVVDHSKREQIDLAVTVAQILGINLPGSKGQVMTELFSSPQ